MIASGTDGSSAPAAALLLAGLMAAFAWLGLLADRPPAALPATAPVSDFSAARARVHLREITRAPHPVGSPAHAQVRRYLVEALHELGMQPQIHHTTAISPFAGNYAADVYNILGRRVGTDSTGAILLMAHYDSVVASFGASDDGAGVSAILETLRALQARGPLRNDLIVLISDAEELGLLGAAAFAAEHPWFTDVALVLNVEARGSHGASYMFQTVGPNGRLIPALAATPRPMANTVMQEVYERIPNGTDLTVFRDAGVPGMDFAYVRRLSEYHTPLDNFETQDPASLQHHGSYLLGLATEFGATDLRDLDAPERTYFNLGALAFVHYPAAWILPLALLAAVLVNGTLAYALARGLLRPVPVLVGLGSAVVAVGGSSLLAHLVWSRVAAVSESVAWDPYRLFHDSTPYLLAFCAGAAALTVALTALGRRWATPAEQVAGPAVVWALAAVAAAVYMPGVAYLLTWPALGGLAGLVLCVRPPSSTVLRASALGLAAAPALLLALPWVEWLEVTMTLRFVAVSVGLLTFVMVLLAAQVELLLRAWGWRVPAALLVLSAAAAGWAWMSPAYDGERPRPDQLSYVADLDSGEALWVSRDPQVDDWTRQVLGEDPRRGPLPRYGLGQRTYMQRAAPAQSLAGPGVTTVADVVEGPNRVVDLRIEVDPGTYQTAVEALEGASAITAMTLHVGTLNDGVALDVPGESSEPAARLVTFMGSPAEGIGLRLRLAPGQPLQLRVRTVLPGLPGTLPPRPAGTMSRGFDVTLLQRTFGWEASAPGA